MDGNQKGYGNFKKSIDLIDFMDRVRIIINEVINYKREGRMKVNTPINLVYERVLIIFIFISSRRRIIKH